MTWKKPTNNGMPFSTAFGACKNIQIFAVVGNAPNAKPQRAVRMNAPEV